MRKRQKPAVGLLSTEEELKTYLNPPRRQPIGLLDIAYEKLKTKHKNMTGGLLDDTTKCN
jgi:hypothetical protein